MPEGEASGRGSARAMRAVSHYDILEKLGEGGMGIVWKARDTRLDRLVAIKFLPPEKIADPDRKRRFMQEARAASALNHPHIIAVHDIDQADGADFIVMEYVSGKTLEQLIPSKGMKTGDAVRYAIQIADALAAAHNAGIVHRDLKPANVMVSDAGRVKVLDFGLAKLQDGTSAGDDENTRTLAQAVKTEEGVIAGSACYMSPEQAEGRKVDARSDIFSFGSVLYEMLSGRRAFRGDSRVATLAAVLRAEPEPLEKLADSAPRELVRLVQRCLRKDPEDRAQSMADLRNALKEIKQESESGLVAGAPANGGPRQGKWRWIAAGFGVVAVAGGGAYYLLAPGRSAPPAALQATMLTSYPGVESQPSFSPDGSQVAFVWSGAKQDNYDIYVKLLGPGRPLRLTTDPGADYGPAWSPDGRWIAFRRARSLFVIPPIGGTEREVAQGLPFPAPASTGFLLANGLLPGVSWSPDGRWLVAGMYARANGPLGLYLVSVETGERRRLTTPPEFGPGDLSGEISPDGRTLAFTRILNNGDTALTDSSVYTLALGNDYSPRGEPRRIVPGGSLVSGLAWTADSKEIVFSWYKRGAFPSLWSVGASGTQPPVKLAVGDDGVSPAISRQGRLLAYERAVGANFNIWRIDVGDPAQPSTPLIDSTRPDVSPKYSPDGSKIAFMSERSGIAAIWVCDADGENAVQLTDSGQSGSPQWSPDGQRIVFDRVTDGKWQVFTMSARGGPLQQLTWGASGHSRPSWSHDGKWIYAAGGGGIQKIPAGGGQPVQLVSDGGTNPEESVDGKTIYYENQGRIWQVRADGSGGPVAIKDASTSVFAGGLGLAVVRDGIYYATTAHELRFFSFARGHSREIFKLEKPVNLGVSVSPDQKWLLFSQEDAEATGDLMLVDPFR
jgi:serine/threonine protein kinase/dipeptidyl aminopeptidase/acylaminoacyl peptidase